MGATDYLVKPVRIQECKALTTKMKRRQPAFDKDAPEIQGLAKYEHLRRIG